jgi:hypothetical protein
MIIENKAIAGRDLKKALFTTGYHPMKKIRGRRTSRPFLCLL